MTDADGPDGVFLGMKLYKSREWLYQAYVVDKKSSTQMAKEARCKIHTILKWMKHYEIPLRSPSEAVKLRNNDPVYRSKWEAILNKSSEYKDKRDTNLMAAINDPVNKDTHITHEHPSI